jgi:hypothetical protein
MSYLQSKHLPVDDLHNWVEYMWFVGGTPDPPIPSNVGFLKLNEKSVSMNTKLKRLIEECSARLLHLFEPIDPEPPLITLSGSAAGIFKPELLGSYIFKREVGDVDLGIAHPRVRGYIVTKGMSVWMNSYNRILSVPAAAYSLQKRISHYLTWSSAGKEVRRMAEVVDMNLEGLSHPFGTYEELIGPLEQGRKEELRNINLSNLKIAIDYTLEELRSKGPRTTLHDLFKHLGSICARHVFRSQGCLVTRRDAIEMVSEESREVASCWEYIQRKWEDDEIGVEAKEVEGFLQKCHRILYEL